MKISKDNVIVVTISTVIGALLIGVFSPVFSPLSESVRDQLTGEPNATVISAMTFDKDNKEVTKPVNNDDTISSNSIRFDFKASQKSPIGIQPPNPSSFQCSLDGAPFEDCVSPKSYGDLPTEAGHTFQVRAIGILGNIDKSPHKFYFTTITSASIEGVVTKGGNDSKEGYAKIILDWESQPRNTSTDSTGRFEFEGVGQGPHKFITHSTTLGPRWDNFFVPAGQQMMKETFDILEMPPWIDSSQATKKNSSTPNPGFKGSNDTTQNYKIVLAQETKDNPGGPNPYSTKIWLNASENVLSKIQNVSYYLHPTFNPSVITSYTKENKFIITFTNWGVFDLKAKVYFKDGIVQDLELPSGKWIKS